VKCSDKGIRVIQEFEGLATECYDDVGGKPTIGYGHLIRKGETYKRVSEEQATRLLCDDLKTAEACVEESVDVQLTQGQFDALVSFVFNLGCFNLKRSSLLKLLNAGKYAEAKSEFTKWSFVGQEHVAGLLRRRIAEQLLWES
jgi:lysozyme